MLSSPLPRSLEGAMCPLCANPNHCAMEAAKSLGKTAASCWCQTTTLTPELLARLPAGTPGTVCICQACADPASTPRD